MTTLREQNIYEYGEGQYDEGHGAVDAQWG